MNEATARQLTTKLGIAYPGRMPDATFVLYASELAELEDAGVARVAVDELIRDSDQLPPVAQLRRRYFDALDRQRNEGARIRGLPEPEREPIHPDVLAGIERFLGHPFSPLRDMDDAGDEPAGSAT
jgi:hypothetical protein